MHPVFNKNLAELTDDELHKSHGELMKKMTQASRLGYAGVVGQMQMILSTYNDEIVRRNNEKLEKMRQKNQDLDQYINIE